MFTFTTTNVINTKTEATSGKELWKVIDSSTFQVKRVNNFKADNVIAIYKAKAVDAELAKVTIDINELGGADGDQFRLALYIGLTQASQDSRYSNDLIYKGKPFTVEFIWKDSAEKTAEKLAKVIKKYQALVYGDKQLNVTQSGTCISIEATTEYQRFRKVNIEKLDEKAHWGMGEYNVVRSLEDLTEKTSNAAVTDTAEGYFVGKEGFGTYSYILHNLRIPTWARTNAFAINQDESPIPGAKYTQYTIRYCVNRGPLGLNAVGDTVKSITTHVFFVKEDLADDFEAGLKNIGTITEVGPGIADVPEDKLVDSDIVSTKDVDTLNEKVEALTTKVDELSKQVNP